MQFLLDNLVATVVAGVVSLLLVAISVDRAEGTRDAVRLQAHQTIQTSFTEQLEWDLTNAGVLVPSGTTAVQTITGDTFSFYGLVDTVGTSGLISYVRVPADSLDGSAVFAVERYVDGVRSGGTAGVLSRFDIDALSNGGVPVTIGTLDQTRSVRVATEWVLPFAEDDGARTRQALRRSAWSTHVRPLGLQL